MISGYAFTEGSGTTLTNLGVGNTLGSSWPNIGNGAIVGTEDWKADADGSPYLTMDGEYARIFLASGDTTLTRGTFVARIQPITSGSLLCNQLALATANHFRVGYAVATDVATVNFILRSPAGVLYTSPGVSFSIDVPHSILVSWGERGLVISVDRYDPSDSQYTVVVSTNTDPIIVPNTKYLVLQANVSGASGSCDWYSCALFDGQPQSSREFNDLLCDPELPFRPSPTRTTLSPVAAADMGCVTETTAIILQNTGIGIAGELPSASVGVRAYVSSDRYSVMDAAPVSASVSATTDVQQRLDINLSGLTSGTRYWYHREWTSDGSTWHPFPTGFGTFRAKPSAGVECSSADFADDHLGGLSGSNSEIFNPDSGGYVPEIGGFDIELFESISPLSVSLIPIYRAWLVSRDIYNDPVPVDLMILFGDHFYVNNTVVGTGDWDAQRAHDISVVKDCFYLASLTGMMVHIPGNHDAGRGDYADKDGSAKTKISTLLWKTYTNNPTDETYPEGGESEGIPTITSQLSWQHPISVEHDADWRRTYEIDGGGDEGIEHGTPLMNYFAFTWGDSLHVIIDTNRYSFIDGATVGSLGIPQNTWCVDTLWNSSAKWKRLLGHSLISGAVTYQWGSGIDIGLLSTEESNLHLVCQGVELTEFAFGHNHTFGWVIKDGVNYVCVPTPTNSSFVAGTDHLMELQFGTAQSEGYTLYLGADGSGLSRGIQKRLHLMGYLKTTWNISTFTHVFRLTSGSQYSSGSEPCSDSLLFSERWAGKAGLSSSSQSTVLSERPQNILFVIPESELTSLGSTWWQHSNLVNAPDGSPAGHNYRLVDPPGDYVMEEDHAGSTISLHASTPDGDIRVFATPMNIFSAELTNAKLDQPSSSEFEQQIPASIVKGQLIGAIHVGLYNMFGTLLDDLTGYYGTIALQKNGNTVPGLSGTLIKPFINGIATFDDLVINSVGIYRLLVTVSGG
jgi:hypothetical protein